MSLRESTNVLEDGPKKKRARTQVEKSESNSQKYLVLPTCKESCIKKGIINFSSDDRALINSRLWKFSFTERCQLLVAHINQFHVKNKASQQKDRGWLSSRERLLPLKERKSVVVYKTMFLSTHGLSSDGMITEIVRAQHQSCGGAISPIQDRRISHPPSNKCDAEVIHLHINSDNTGISHYKQKNGPHKHYLNLKLSIKEMYKNHSENKENNKICYKT